MAGKTIALIFGVVFTLVGLLGFVGGLGIVGPDGFFATDTVHDLIHLVSGVVFLVIALYAPSKSSLVLMIFGVVYALVAVLGFLTSGNELLGIVLINSADNWLHVVLALGTFFGGFLTRPKAGSFSA